MKILLFQIGKEIFGMELKSIDRIVICAELEHGFEGELSDNTQVINWQKNLIPVINLQQMLQEGTRTEVKRIFIILSFNNRLRAVPVDNAEEICDVAYDRIMPVPKTILDRKENRILNGIAVLKDKMIPLIDHSVLFKVAVTDPLF